MKNKNKLIIPLALVSSIIALIIYLIKGSTSIGWLFLVIPSIYLAIETNVYFRQLRRIFWRLIFLIIQFFILIAFYSRMGGNGFISFLADFLLLYFIFQLGESLYLYSKRLFQKTIKKKYSVVGLIILVLIIIGIPFSINRQNKTDKIINVGPLEVPQAAFNCSTEISTLFQKNNKSIEKYLVESKQLKWNGQSYNASIFNCPDEQQSYEKVFLLSKVDNTGNEKILFSMTDGRFNSSEIRDINQDKLGELIIEHSNGGNCWACGGSSLFQIVGDNVTDLLPNLPKSEGGQYAIVQWIGDIDRDGIEEVSYIDDSRELADGFFHSNSPFHQVLLTWNDGEYVRGGELFSKFYLNQISMRNKELEKLAKSKDIRLNDLVSLAIDNFSDYLEIGKSDIGYDTFIRQIDNLPKTLVVSDEEKVWLQGIKQEIEDEYNLSKPTPTPEFKFPR